MTLSEYRDTYSWQGAIALGPKLMQLAEELPGSEEHGLGRQLRSLMVKLPADIAADLIAAHDANLTSALRLTAILELIDKVYPALDTAATRTLVDELTTRLASANFTERTGDAALSTSNTSQPAAPARPAEAAPAAETPVLSSEVKSEAPAPTSVSVSAEPASEKIDVHPDSV